MERKDIKVGTRVRPSGQGFTKNWNVVTYMRGTVVRIGRNFITVDWGGGYVSSDLKPMHLELEPA